ncbi:hypothetical protein LAD64_24210 [Klebsiella pneumoniae]|nr:hypothetical protein [Klebsiella pneumoniae]
MFRDRVARADAGRHALTPYTICANATKVPKRLEKYLTFMPRTIPGCAAAFKEQKTISRITERRAYALSSCTHRGVFEREKSMAALRIALRQNARSCNDEGMIGR